MRLIYDGKDTGSEFVDYNNESCNDITHIEDTGYILISLVPRKVLMEASRSILIWTVILVALGAICRRHGLIYGYGYGKDN